MSTSHRPTQDLELCGAKTGNCFRAAVGLAEAGLPYRVRRINLGAGEQRSRAYLSLNPAGQVPALIIGESRESPNAPARVLTQSSAILFYADEMAPGRLLPPHGTPWRIRALEAFFYFTSDVIATSGIAFRLQSQGHGEAADLLTKRYLDALTASERFISEAGYMGGEDFSIADIAAFTIASASFKHVPWERVPRLAAWRDLIARRPAVVSGMAAFD